MPTSEFAAVIPISREAWRTVDEAGVEIDGNQRERCPGP
jgi:hypothetical protein